AVAPGYWADLVVLDGLDTLTVCDVYYRGNCVAEFHAQPKLPADSPLRQSVHCAPISLADFACPVSGESHVIELIPGQLVTGDVMAQLPSRDGLFVPNEVYSKLAVIERHKATGKMGVAAVRGFGIRGGAVASSVAHDSHNLSVIGDNDEDMLLAIRELQRTGGGYTVVSGGKVLHTVPLPIMGLMSDAGFTEVQNTLAAMLDDVHGMGVPENIEPFILLSFLALPVIPALRLTPRGLFDVTGMQFVEVS
ncbi:MAG: adenine deaminase C-terminal domain-containing protein, partial [Butyricicoccaceae bacterium]